METLTENTTAQPKEVKKNNRYDNSLPIELDWQYFGTNALTDGNMERAVWKLSEILKLSGNPQVMARHIRTLLVVCSRMEKYAPDSYVAYSRDNNFDYLGTLRNPFNIRLRTLRKVIDALEANGWLESRRGIHFWDYKRLSRFKAREGLKQFISSHKLTELPFYRELVTGGIILKDQDKRIVTDYQETDGIWDLRAMLAAYNKLIAKTKIELAKADITNRYFFDRVLTYRVFNGNFEQGGRFYGGWWANCKKQDRPYITINGSPTIELDYKANHLFLLYGLNDRDMPEAFRADPYKISEEVPRGLMKLAFVTAINSGDEMQAWRSFMRELISNESWKDLRSFAALEGYRKIVRMLVEAHPLVERYLHTGYGTSLMFYDAQIAEYVLAEMTERQVPCLCVHDSFIVPIELEAALAGAMTDAYIRLRIPKGLPPIEVTRSALLN